MRFLRQITINEASGAPSCEKEGSPVIQDADSCQRLLDLAAQADACEGVRQGLEDARRGSSRPAEEFFREFEAKHGLSS